MDTLKAQNQKTINFKVGDLVRIKKGGQKLLFPTNKSAGIIIKELSETTYGKHSTTEVTEDETGKIVKNEEPPVPNDIEGDEPVDQTDTDPDKMEDL